ncbi:MAG: nuclear transport factor 2 family protein [Dehalococcoidia bacterium]
MSGLDSEVAVATPGGSDRPDWPQIESAIRQLSVNYSLGTDAIGRGDRAAGERFYAAAFAADAEVMVAGSERSRRTGPEGWADYVERTFREMDARRTQHLVGSVNIVLGEDGRTADVSSYLHAAHVRSDGAVYTVILTYADRVVLGDAGWRIARRTLYPAGSWTEPK